MSYWKDFVLGCIDLETHPESAFEFGPPASADELRRIKERCSIPIPDDLLALLNEFNGLSFVDGISREPILFSTTEMLEAIQYYRNWDVPTDRLINWSNDILYLSQTNGFAMMQGILVTDLDSFKAGVLLEFDHDNIENAGSPVDLFRICEGDLATLIQNATIDYC